MPQSGTQNQPFKKVEINFKFGQRPVIKGDRLLANSSVVPKALPTYLPTAAICKTMAPNARQVLVDIGAGGFKLNCFLKAMFSPLKVTFRSIEKW